MLSEELKLQGGTKIKNCSYCKYAICAILNCQSIFKQIMGGEGEGNELKGMFN